MANSTDILGLNQSSDTVPAIGGDAFEVEARAEQDQMKRAHQRNVSLGLLAAGLATLAARPKDFRSRVTPLEALGEGGLAGISAYGEGEKANTEALKARQMMMLDRLKFGETVGYHRAEIGEREKAIGLEKQKVDIATKDAAPVGKDPFADMRQGPLGQYLNQAFPPDQAAQLSNKNAEEIRTGFLKEGPAFAQRAQQIGLEGARFQQEGARMGLDEQRMALEYGAGGTDTLAPLRKNKDFPADAPLAEYVKSLPKKDALKLYTDIYSSMKQPNKQSSFVQMGDGVHHIITNLKTGETISDKVIGPLKPGKGGGLSMDSINAELKKQGIDVPGAPAAPTAPAPAAPALPSGKPPKSMWGKILTDPTTKQRYQVDGQGNVTPL